MRDRLALLAYVAGVILATSIHVIALLGAGLAFCVLLAGRRAPRIAKRAALSLAVFNSVVTVSYLVISLWRGEFSAYFVVLLNLRVFLLTFMTFLLVDRVNLLNALSFSKSMRYLLTITYSQTMTFRRIFSDFRLALKSRTIRRLKARDLYRHGASTGAYFLNKAMNDATEVSRAMNSRGFFRA
jgi:cobalt/nickel transport system permease protein